MDQPGPPVPPASPTPIPVVVAEGSEPDRGGAGIDRKAESIMDGLSAMWSGACMVFGWLWNGGRRNATRFIAWNRADRRNVGITALSVAFVIVCFVAYNGHDSTTGNPQPPRPATATQQTPASNNGMRKHTVKKGEHLASIGKVNGVNRLEMENANPGIDVNKLKVGQVVNVPVPAVAKNEN